MTAAAAHALRLGARPGFVRVGLLAMLATVLVGQPVLALFVGMACGVLADRPLFNHADALGKVLLQAAIVLLAFRLDAAQLLHLGAEWTGWIAGYVALTLALGLALGWLLRVQRPMTQLIATGTAICGATAIAAVAPGIRAPREQLAVALAVVFLLNAVALLLFPAIGQALGLSQHQFGLWAALAVHDTASVVATASAYGDEAAVVAASAKIIRTLFLVPVLVFGCMVMRRAGMPTAAAERPPLLPRFVVLFLAVVLLNSLLSLPTLLASGIQGASTTLLVVALFLIGAGFRLDTLKHLRGRGVLLAVLLWALVAPLALLLVLNT